MKIKNDINSMLELTRQDAAMLLCVPLIYLDAFLAKEGIRFVGSASDRRVWLHDVMAYKRKREAVRSAALNEIAKLRSRQQGPVRPTQEEADLIPLADAHGRQDGLDSQHADVSAGT